MTGTRAVPQGLDARASANRVSAARLPALWLVPVVFVAVIAAVFSRSVLVGVLVAVIGAGYVFGVVARTVVPRIKRVVGGRPASAVTDARFANLVEGLCITYGVPEPELVVVDDEAVNALCVGSPGQSLLAVTSGLLGALDRVQLEGVVAECLGRIRSHDAELGGRLAVMVCGRALLLNGPERTGPLRGLTPHFASAKARRVARALGTNHDMLADMSAASITRYPPGLQGALVAAHERGSAVRGATWATAHLWIMDPLVPSDDPRSTRLNELFGGRVPLEHRIDLLGEL